MRQGLLLLLVVVVVVTIYGGGLVGRNEGTITDSYYNDGATITGESNTDGTQTMSALQTPTDASDIYTTWGDAWDFGTAAQYPALKADFDGDV